MKPSEAAETLQSVRSAREDIMGGFRPPVLLALLLGASFGLVVFGWGMTEHENLWALAMYIGAAGVFLSAMLYQYTLRLLGMKINFFPRTMRAVKFQFSQIVVFGILVIASRQVRLAGFEFAPHIAAICAGILLAVLVYRYPTGEFRD